MGDHLQVNSGTRKIAAISGYLDLSKSIIAFAWSQLEKAQQLWLNVSQFHLKDANHPDFQKV
jgi:hypothetical protein